MHYESLSLVFLCHHYERYSRDVRNPSFRSMVVKMFTLNVMRTQTKTKNVSLLRTALMDIITKSRIVLDLSLQFSDCENVHGDLRAFSERRKILCKAFYKRKQFSRVCDSTYRMCLYY